ncbi:MAG: hypothetical protein HY791_04770 [Deltaproteobacteria bacterium]|nr:hypothetical protein [Deltaproteobacteria bacterium]
MLGWLRSWYFGRLSTFGQRDRAAKAASGHRASGWFVYVSFALSCFVSACQSRVLALQLDLNENIAYGAVTFESDQGVVSRATPLIQLDSTVFESDLDPELDGDEWVRFIGYARETLAQGLGESFEPRGDNLRLAERTELALPLPDQIALGPVAERSLEPANESAVLTADWLPSCVADACELAAFGQGRLLELPGDVRSFTAGAQVGPDEAVAVSEERWLRVTKDQVTEVLVEAPGAGPVIDLFMDPDHQLWAMRVDGTISRGGVETGFVQVAHLDGHTGPGVLAGGRNGSNIEIFVASARGLFRVTTEGAELVFPSDRSAPSNDVSVEWLGPGKAAAIFGGPNVVVWYDRASVPPIQTQPFPLGPTAIANLPGTGLVVSSTGHLGLRPDLLVWTDQGWRSLGVEVPTASGAEILEPWAGGLLHGGISGELAYHHPGIGNCAPWFLAPLTIRRLLLGSSSAIVLVGYENRAEMLVFDLPSRRLPCRSGRGR